MSVLKKYPPQLFHSVEIKDAFKIATKTKFANLTILNHSDIDVIFNPFYNLFQQTGRQQFYGHLARVNPLYDILINKNQQQCQLVFNATDAYISPIVYKQKLISHNVVLTWNYVAAQFKGIIKILPDNQLQQLLHQQVQIFQKQVNSQWRLNDSSPQYLQKLKKSIFGIKIQVNYWKSHFKLSQNKSQDDIKRIKQWSLKRNQQDNNIVQWMNQFK